MKITIQKIIAAACTCLLFVACDFSMPEKLQVKASPRFDVGSTDFSLASYLSVEKMQELMGSGRTGSENENANDSEIQIFDYIPSADSSIMQYAVRYPVFKEIIPLNFMSAFDFDEGLGKSVNMKFDIPSADEYTNNLEKDAEFYIPETEKETTYSLADISDVLPPNYECTSTISIGDVGMTFSEDSKLDIQIDQVVPESGSENYKLTLDSITLSCPDNDPIATLEGPYDLTRSEGNILHLPIGGKKLQGDISIDISVTTSGGKGFNIEKQQINLAKMTMKVSAGNAKIAYLHDVKVPMDEEFKEKLSNDLSLDMPEEMAKWIESAQGTACVTIDLENKLPEDMDIDIELTSNLLDIQHDSQKFPSGEKANREYRSSNSVTINPENGDPFDLKLAMDLAGYDESNNTMTFKKIEPGTSITLDGSVSCKFDFEDLKLKANQSYSGSYPAENEPGLDLSALGDFLPEGLGLASVPVYVYMSSPVLEKFTAIKDSVTGFVRVSYTDNETSKNSYLIGNKDANSEIQFEAPPEFPVLIDNSAPVLTADLDGIPWSGRTDFAEIVNSAPSDLAFSYQFNLGTIELNKEEFKLLEDPDLAMEMSVDLVIVLPLALRAENVDSSGGVLLNINEFAGIEKNISDRSDLFGRNSAGEETDEIRDIIHGLKSLGIKLTCHDMMFSSGSSDGIKIVLKQNDFEKKFLLPKSGEKRSLSFALSDVDKMLDLYPFFPDVSLFIPAGEWNIPRDAKIKMDIGVFADVDMEYSF